MAIWTDDQINAILAELGLRTPGKPMPDNPERIVAGELLTARQRVTELTQQVLETNTLYERTAAERDRLIPLEDERNDLQQKLAESRKTIRDMTDDVTQANTQRDVAYSMVRDLEVRVRLLQAQIAQQQGNKP